MEILLSNLSIGVIAGLVATLLAVVFARIWASVIDPWIEERLYRDARIEGRWRSTGTFVFPQPGEVVEEFIWTLTRTGHTVKGTIVCLSGPDQGRTYLFEGLFRNLLLTGTYSSQSPSALERGTVSFMLVNNGDTFQGYCLYYCFLDHEVRSCEEVLTKEAPSEHGPRNG